VSGQDLASSRGIVCG